MYTLFGRVTHLLYGCFVFTLLVLPYAETALEGAKDQVQIGDRVFLKLGAIADRLGMVHQWQDPPNGVKLLRDWASLEFEKDKREFLLNGLRVHLGFPILALQNDLFLSLSDYEATVIPILTPQPSTALPVADFVVLDPGHGGKDPGTSNMRRHLIEKDMTLDVARRLQRVLISRGFRVSLIRGNDRFIGLEERAAGANDLGADVFVSLHFNYFRSPQVKGPETYVLTPVDQPSTARSEIPKDDAEMASGNAYDDWNILLGYYVQRQLVKQLGQPDRGLKRARWHVLRSLKCPGILVESGFVSNPEEAAKLETVAYRERIALSIGEGIEAYRRTLIRLENGR